MADKDDAETMPEIQELRSAEARLKKIEWMLSPKTAPGDAGRAGRHDQGYGDLTELNHDGIILKSIGRERLETFASDYLDLLGTSSAIYEINGDYAFGIFSSGWCRMMDRASRSLCNTSNNVEALNSGRWLCHESCWTDCAQKAIDRCTPVEIECNGGLRIYSVPILVHGKIAGVINFGYGDPPKDPEKLRKLATAYRVDYDDIVREAYAYDSRPSFIINLAKKRLHASARIIGSMIETRQAEDALRESERRFRLLADNSADVIWAMTLDGRFTYASPSVKVLSGYTPEEVLAIPFQEYVVESYVEPVMNELAAHLQKPLSDRLQSRTMELQQYCKDGSTKDIEVTVSWLLNEQGDCIGVQGSTRDITERKLAEEQLRRSEAKYRNIFENMQDVYYETSLDGLILEISPSIEAISSGQYRQADLIGRQMLDFYEDAEERDNLVAKLLETGSVSDVEISLRNRDGSLVPCSISAVLWRDDQGNPVKIIGSMRDITKRKKAEAERERLITAIEQGDDVVIITDIEGLIQYANPAFETVTGYTRKEVLGQNPRIFKSGKQDEAFYREMWDTLTSGNTFHGRMINKRKDGSLYTEDATISPVLDAAGNIVNYVAVKRDVTAHIQLETQLIQAQKMESVGRLAGGVAHDYNNMLFIILGYTEMALEQVDPAGSLHADLMEVYNAGKRSMEITRQLLAFARRQTIAPKALDLNETVEGMLKMLRRLIGEDIELEWHPVARLWPVNMDPSQVDQILANLCVNARDAIDDVGKVTIETENITFDDEYCENHMGFIPGKFVMLAVSDNGCGMNKETLNNLFEPFFTTKAVGEGTGLGLATIYGIVKQNNGLINVYSEPGEGTTFKIYLPRYEGEAEPATAEIADEPTRGRGETILLVEDEPKIIKMGKMMLEKLGYHVLTAETPGRAMDLAREHAGKIDLLMTDVIMPEMNGRDLAEKLQTLNPELNVLFMSGYTANAIAHHGVLDEGVHFIQKPFSRAALAEKVREAIGNDE
jgi:two-component system, cell cycle sensor histidine kinase and response regulator CckA